MTEQELIDQMQAAYEEFSRSMDALSAEANDLVKQELQSVNRKDIEDTLAAIRALKNK
jgi:Xaa-Pro aminopeptidase